MKITVYTISDCPFSKQEKEYLASHNLQFEEKNLETNKEFLTEMLAVSSNFAGTPVTKIEKDDGQIAVLKGFTQSEFDQTLNLQPASVPTPTPQPTPEPVAPPVVEPPAPSNPVTPPAVPPTDDVQKVVNELAAQGSDVPPTTTPPVPGEPPAPPSPTPNPTEPSQPVVNLVADAAMPSMPSLDTPPAMPTPPVPAEPPVVEPPAPPMPQPPVDQPMAEAPANDKLNSILANLQQKVNTSQTPPPTPFAGQPRPTADQPLAGATPTIPDFH